MHNRNNFKGRSGLRRIINAFAYSLDGYKAAWNNEEAFRQIVFISILGIPSALYFGASFAEKILLLLPCVICIIVELLNSAIENAVDRISLDTHELSKKAKDMGSAAQFSAQLFLGLTWVVFIVCSL